MKNRLIAAVAVTCVVAVGAVGWWQAHAQLLPTAPPLPSLPSAIHAPSTAPSAAPTSASVPQVGLTPTTLTPFVPTGADPASLVEGGVLLTPATNTNPPINTYSSALNYLAACDPYATGHIANAGFGHVKLLNQVDTGAPYQADVWAFATTPYSYPDDAWYFWFIDAGSGSCRGVGYGPASNDPSETITPLQQVCAAGRCAVIVRPRPS